MEPLTKHPPPEKPLRFHWSMSSVGVHLKGATARKDQSGVPDIPSHHAFCRQAAECGIEHLLTAFGFHRPEPVSLAAAIGSVTPKVNFLIAVRSGVVAPTYFVQQINTLSCLIQGRVCVNVIAGHSPEEHRYYGDFLEPEQRYERTDEFMAICQALWDNQEPVNFRGNYYQVHQARINTPFQSPDRARPEIYFGGKSEQSIDLAMKYGDCLLTMPDAPELLAPKILPVLQSGTSIGLLISILTRPTREKALADAYAMIERLGSDARQVHRDFKKHSVSHAFNSVLHMGDREEDWLSPCLWTGAVPYLGAPAIALVGSYEEVAAAIMDYKLIGISEFLWMGWPDDAEMIHFSRGVLPLVRAMESRIPQKIAEK